MQRAQQPAKIIQLGFINEQSKGTEPNSRINGKKISNLVPCTIKNNRPEDAERRETITEDDHSSTDAYQQLLSKRSTKRTIIKEVTHIREDKTYKKTLEHIVDVSVENKNKSQSKSKSKQKSKSKDLAQFKSKSSRNKPRKSLGFKSRSLIRLFAHENRDKDLSNKEQTRGSKQRKSESPPKHYKSSISLKEKPKFKSNYNSKSNQDHPELLRDKSRSQLRVGNKNIQTTKRNEVQINYQSCKQISKKGKQKQMPKGEKRKKTNNENGNVKKNKSQPKKRQKYSLVDAIPSKGKTRKIKRNNQSQNSLSEGQQLDQKYRDLKKSTDNLKATYATVKGSVDKQLPANIKQPSKMIIQEKKQSRKLSTQHQKKTEQIKGQNLQNKAAIKIQKAFRGFLTRKYLRQFLQLRAAIMIQRHWRSYRAKKAMIGSRNKKQILVESDYLLKESSEKRSEHSQEQMKGWTGILEQVLLETNLNESLKQKIVKFLQKQKQQLSKSVWSSQSSKVVQAEINSERRYIQQAKSKKKSSQLFISPKRSGSYQSPKMHSDPRLEKSLIMFVPSPELLIENLTEIQNFHKDKLIGQVNLEKAVLIQRFQQEQISPNSYRRKQKELEEHFDKQISKFDQSFGDVMKTCKDYQSQIEESRQLAFTPQNDKKKKQQALEILADFNQADAKQIHGTPQNIQRDKSQQLEILDQNTLPANNKLFKPFDSSYFFIEEYLLQLIEFVRQTRNGVLVKQVNQLLRTARNLTTDLIFKNLHEITDESDNGQAIFKLPMYKYLDTCDDIFSTELTEQFNNQFKKLQRHSETDEDQPLQEHFIKMTADSLNEALNNLRPLRYIFTQGRMQEVNYEKRIAKQKLSFTESISEQFKYHCQCVKAMNQIFDWHEMRCGKLQDQYQSNTHQLWTYREINMKKMLNAEVVNWDYFDELIEVIAKIEELAFEHLILEECQIIF